MKKSNLTILTVLLSIIFLSSFVIKKAPVVVEISTNHKTIKEALLAIKTELMNQKFIPNGGLTETGFTATRTTGSRSDYYTADVLAEQVDGNIKITLTLIKSGTGLLKLQKVADEIKEKLEK